MIFSREVWRHRANSIKCLLRNTRLVMFVRFAATFLHRGHYQRGARLFFLFRPLPPFPPTSRKRDAAYGYLKYWITVKGCST